MIHCISKDKQQVNQVRERHHQTSDAEGDIKKYYVPDLGKKTKTGCVWQCQASSSSPAGTQATCSFLPYLKILQMFAERRMHSAAVLATLLVSKFVEWNCHSSNYHKLHSLEAWERIE